MPVVEETRALWQSADMREITEHVVRDECDAQDEECDRLPEFYHSIPGQQSGKRVRTRRKRIAVVSPPAS